VLSITTATILAHTPADATPAASVHAFTAGVYVSVPPACLLFATALPGGRACVSRGRLRLRRLGMPPCRDRRRGLVQRTTTRRRAQRRPAPFRGALRGDRRRPARHRCVNDQRRSLVQITRNTLDTN